MKFKETLKKINLSFVSKLQGRLFKDLAADCAGVSAVFVMSAFIATAAGVVVALASIAFGAEKQTTHILLGIVLGLGFIGASYRSYKPVLAIPTIGLKIAFIAYLVFLYGAIITLTGLLINLLMWLLAIIILIPVCLFLWNYFMSSPDSYTVTNSDGTTSTYKKSSGLMGEQSYDKVN